MLPYPSHNLWHLLLLYSVLVAIGRTARVIPTLLAAMNQWFV